MTQHLHSTFVEGCYRCDISRDEARFVDDRQLNLQSVDNDGTWSDTDLSIGDNSLGGDKYKEIYVQLTGQNYCEAVALDLEHAQYLASWLDSWCEMARLKKYDDD